MTLTNRTLTALAAAATLGVVAIATPQAAQAHGHHHHGHFVFIGAPLGAYAYYDPFSYGGCYWTHRRVWNGVRWHLRRVQICG
jgi:hypothetical protein